VTDGTRFRAALLDALRQEAPFLRRAMQTQAGMFGSITPDPSAFPDHRPQPTFYSTDPLPSGTKAAGLTSLIPRFEGQFKGRPWSVDVAVPDMLAPRVTGTTTICTLVVKTYVRCAPPGAEGRAPTPWLAFGGVPEPVPPSLRYPQPYFGPVGEVGHHGIQGVVVRTGRPPVPRSVPPVAQPIIIEGWPTEAAAALASPEILGLWAGWEARCGYPWPGGPTRPFLRFTAHRLEFVTGMDPGATPALHARTVVELADFVTRVEQFYTGLDPEASPISFFTANGPPGTLPVVRPQFICPRCGQLELVRIVSVATPKMVRFASARCNADVFPPIPA
jgi:hypothetical protein